MEDGATGRIAFVTPFQSNRYSQHYFLLKKVEESSHLSHPLIYSLAFYCRKLTPRNLNDVTCSIVSFSI